MTTAMRLNTFYEYTTDSNVCSLLENAEDKALYFHPKPFLFKMLEYEY